MNSGYYPVVVNPGLKRVQTQSQQTPFYFGGSQVPTNLNIKPKKINIKQKIYNLK
jgi:hypothetical protein